MVGGDTAIIRGELAVRPWRVGLLVDTHDEEDVRGAIASLCSAWGGLFLPILDRNESIVQLREAARLFDLDSLYAEESEGDLQDLLRSPGYSWQGRGPWGPFAEGEYGFHRGLLPISALSLPNAENIWSGPHRPSLLRDAYLGISPEGPGPQPSICRAAQRTTHLLHMAKSWSNPLPRGFCVIRDNTVNDTAWYWNCRALAGDSYPLSSNDSEFNEAVLSDAALGLDGLVRLPPGGEVGERSIPVWGADDLSGAEEDRLRAWAKQHDITLSRRGRSDALSHAWFSGYERIVSSSFRVEIPLTAGAIHASVPALPLARPGEVMQGIVAAEVNFHEAVGLDPRLTVAFPPHRRHSDLLKRALARGADHVRISSVGPVFGVQANAGSLDIPTAANMDVMRVLFDDDRVTVGQSDEGKFQTRAAEMFGGPMHGSLTQPGLRAAIQRVATRGGVTLHELERVFADERGAWPDQLRSFHVTPDDYVRTEVRRLLNTGLLVPSLDVQCPHCRVMNRPAPSALDTVFRCDFCQEEIRLALALALTKPTWRYRLAGHLPPERVQAFLPAMAAAGVLAGMHFVEGPTESHVFGLEVRLPNRTPIEIDTATILHEQRWVVVIGEVKNHNAIDRRDVTNLAEVQSALLSKDVVCIVMYATFKEAFSDTEVAAMRDAVETNTTVVTLNGQSVPLMPFLLTHRDMSMPPMDDDHPWRWQRSGSGLGMVGTAIESCRRHLGLVDCRLPSRIDGRTQFKWETQPRMDSV